MPPSKQSNNFRCLGDFEIIRELGRGGMGVVYEARQISLNRKVALKVLSSTLGLAPKAVQRFHREAEAAAKLHHTNIVPVYATGEQDGTHFYAMELIDGPSLDLLIHRTKASRGRNDAPEYGSTGTSGTPDLKSTGPYVPESGLTSASGASSLSSDSHYFDTVARMVADVADALGYAHKEGVIHRDIKPSNLLLSPAGRLSISDFGLARMLEQPGITISGEFVGTPRYMSPEQIATGRIPVDYRTDIYSLGATLYELLTLEPPYQGKSREQLLAQIIQKEPKAPRRIEKKVPVDLETICLKAMDKDPDRRYQTADAMADDLRRYVNRFAILAKRAGPVSRLVKWARRKPAAAVSLGALVVAIGSALALGYAAYRAERDRRLEREYAAGRLREQEELGRQLLLEEKIRSAYLIAAGGDLKKTEEAIKEIEALGGSTGQVRLLRGVLAYFRQETELAVNELEQAVKLLPESVAARALLAISYCDNGRPEHYDQLYLGLQQLSPVSAEDYLFKGYSRLVVDPREGLPDVNEGIRRQDSPLGRAFRSLVWNYEAQDSGKLEDAEKALADAAVARGMLPDNQFVVYADLYARLVAAGLYQQAHQPDRRLALLREASYDVQALEPSIGRPVATWMMWQYHMDVGDADQALNVALRTFRQSQGCMPALYCATSLYLRGEFADAVRYLDQRQPRDMIGEITRCFILAELPDGAHRAREAFDQLVGKYPQYSSYPLFLLGRKSEGQAALRRHKSTNVSRRSTDLEIAVQKFNRGELSPDAFLASVAGFRTDECDAHFLIGLFRLADGDRVGAKSEFALAVQTRVISMFNWDWSLMFRNRLEKDPRWPPWIPLKK